ncbi:hypothetical protein CVT25_014639 [Psilocybe cyanescens]|uniref:Uncharacterized protein n=1 Tax=Psilocybe cyanescens TaxID=93625 RepID=A0A409WTZ1_PSICY|nr:hypothetical protein CVT25_014639 [Psilocybe cyanescens]
MALSEDYLESGASDMHIPRGYHDMPPHFYKQFVEATMDDEREARKAREALMASASRQVPRPTTLLGTDEDEKEKEDELCSRPNGHIAVPGLTKTYGPRGITTT